MSTYTAFYGIAFDTPPLSHEGNVLDLARLHNLYFEQFEVGLLGYGYLRLNDHRSAIFATKSYIEIGWGMDFTQRLGIQPGWRDELLRYCTVLGIKDPPDPCWTIVRTTD